MISLSRITALSVLLPLCACISVGRPAPANDLYRVETTLQGQGSKPLGVSIRVEEPNPAPGLDTERIAVEDTANHLTYYNGVAWAQSLPLMLQEVLVDGLQRTRGFKSVSSDEDRVASDYALLVDITNYEVENTKPAPTIHVRLAASILDVQTHRTIATFPVEQSVVAQENHMPSIVAAFNNATNEAILDLLHNMKRSLLSAKLDDKREK